MAFNMATTCMKGDPDRTPADVIRLKIALDRQRLLVHEGMILTRFCVLTDYTPEDFLEEEAYFKDDPHAVSSFTHVGVEPLKEGEHPSFATRHVFKNTKFGPMDKTMFIDCKVIPRGVSHSILFSSLPDKGNPNHSSFTIGEEDRKEIITNNWATLNYCVDWTDTEPTALLPYFFQHQYGDHEALVEKMNDDEVTSKYETFQHFIEGEYDEYVLPFQPAIIGKYYATNKEKNLALNEAYEKNVRSQYPEQWRGTGGDEEAKYIEFEHDWRDVTKQTSMLYIDETDAPMHEDYYLRLWVL